MIFIDEDNPERSTYVNDNGEILPIPALILADGWHCSSRISRERCFFYNDEGCERKYISKVYPCVKDRIYVIKNPF